MHSPQHQDNPFDQDATDHQKTSEGSVPIHHPPQCIYDRRRRRIRTFDPDARLEHLLHTTQDAAPLPDRQQHPDDGDRRNRGRRAARERGHGLAADQGADGPVLRAGHNNPELLGPGLAGRAELRLRAVLHLQARRQEAHGHQGVRVLRAHQEEQGGSEQQLVERKCW